MDPKKAIQVLTQLVEQNLALGNFKTFEQLDVARAALDTLTEWVSAE